MGRANRISAFCYCLIVGMLYTRDIRKYALRLGAFALISQPFWIPAFNADNILWNLFNFNLNIFFPLLVSLLATWGFKERKWWLLLAGLILLCPVNFDYAQTGLMLMLTFYISPIWEQNTGSTVRLVPLMK